MKQLVRSARVIVDFLESGEEFDLSENAVGPLRQMQTDRMRTRIGREAGCADRGFIVRVFTANSAMTNIHRVIPAQK
jgi:hypothetical protein